MLNETGPQKQTLEQIIDQLWKTLGFSSRSAFWIAAGITNLNYWNKRLSGKVPTAKKHIDFLIEGLANGNYNLTMQQKKPLYEAIGMIGTSEAPANKVIQVRRSGPIPPEGPEHFGGRDPELNELKIRIKTLQNPDGVIALTAMSGLGGIGKTTIARKLAFDLFYITNEKVFQAVLWKEIKRQPDPLKLLLDWAYLAEPSFQYRDQQPDQLVQQVRTMLNNWIQESCSPGEIVRTLIVFDDVWEDGIEVVRLLRQACPPMATILITTRSELVAIELDAQLQTVDRLSLVAGVELLQTYLKDYRFPETELKSLVEVLYGHTLSLVLAARRLREKPFALAQNIREYRHGLPSGTPFKNLKLDRRETRNDSLTMALSYSYSELTKNEQSRFRALGALAYDQPFDLGILAAVWNGKDLQPQITQNELTNSLQLEQIEEYCERLRLRGLLGIAHQDDSIWYRLHPVLQSYARALLKVDPEASTINQHYQEYIIEIAEQFNKLKPEEWSRLNPFVSHVKEVGDILVALVAEEKKKPLQVQNVKLWNRALGFAINTVRFLFLRREESHLNWLEMGLESSQVLANLQQEAVFLAEIGAHHADLGNSDKALELYNKSLPIFKKVGDRIGEANALNNIGSIYRTFSDSASSLTFFNQALSFFRELHDKNGEAKALNNIGTAYLIMGDKVKSLGFFTQSLLISQAAGDKRNEARTLSNIGLLYHEDGDNEKTLNIYNQALEVFQTIGDMNGEAAVLNNIGRIYENLEDKSKTLEFYNRSMSLSRLVGDRNNEANVLNNIGEIYDSVGEDAKALDFYNQALALYIAVGDKSGEAVVNFNLAEFYYRKSDSESAIGFLTHCVEIRTLIKSPELPNNQAKLTQWRQDQK